MFTKNFLCNLPYCSCVGICKDRRNNKSMKSSGGKGEPVVLNVYDMFWINAYTTSIGLGIFHSGVEIFGTEFAYAGHPLPFTGVFEMTPRDHNELGEEFHFRQSIQIGYTNFTYQEITRIVEELGNEFRGDRYHLINNNCNHFSSALTQVVCGEKIPSWVNRLANFGSYVPFLQRCLPTEWLTPYTPRQNVIVIQERNI